MKRSLSRTPAKRIARRRCNPEPMVLLEPLEERLTPAVFTVGNILDSGAGSLRQAILDANALQGADTIVFDAVFFSTPRT
ncbi:MAG TPA: hypothetical protein VH475_07065, partial [Tepidisphaeraceae bacterium]